MIAHVRLRSTNSCSLRQPFNIFSCRIWLFVGLLVRSRAGKGEAKTPTTRNNKVSPVHDERYRLSSSIFLLICASLGCNPSRGRRIIFLLVSHRVHTTTLLSMLLCRRCRQKKTATTGVRYRFAEDPIGAITDYCRERSFIDVEDISRPECTPREICFMLSWELVHAEENWRSGPVKLPPVGSQVEPPPWVSTSHMRHALGQKWADITQFPVSEHVLFCCAVCQYLLSIYHRTQRLPDVSPLARNLCFLCSSTPRQFMRRTPSRSRCLVIRPRLRRQRCHRRAAMVRARRLPADGVFGTPFGLSGTPSRCFAS